MTKTGQSILRGAHQALAYSKGARRDQLARLAALPERKIDTKDIPEAPAANWKFARRPKFSHVKK